jgi:hypothetical protein
MKNTGNANISTRINSIQTIVVFHKDRNFTKKMLTFANYMILISQTFLLCQNKLNFL